MAVLVGVGMRLTGESGLFLLPQVTHIVTKPELVLFPNPKPGSFPLPYTFAKQVQQLLGDPQRCVRGPGRYRVDKAHFFHVFVI